MKTIAIIPARSGSKGLRDKNIKLLAGKPLLAYSIEAAEKSGVFDEIMVSTDSEHYAAIAREWGASVPFLRSQTTSSDSASSWDAVKEVLKNYANIGQKFDAFCLLQPTSPLRTSQDIKAAYDIFQRADTAVISVCEVEHSPLWCNNLPENNSLEGFIMRGNDKQRQAHKKFYRLNGAIYFVRTEAFFEDSYLFRKGSYAYIMDQLRSVDIDSEIDFMYAEFIKISQEDSGFYKREMNCAILD